MYNNIFDDMNENCVLFIRQNDQFYKTHNENGQKQVEQLLILFEQVLVLQNIVKFNQWLYNKNYPQEPANENKGIRFEAQSVEILFRNICFACTNIFIVYKYLG
ncbi:hypothetical protein LOAG_03071 [Loa loa]|uniref:Uncharacterized protein n=1 Tax=Loa loa TaxID=7209 RepID=A0A1S0U581_LOALO|nr:hypothetical protein LOAG_03071 [Loa loa]EFO25414.1 hypothetical protein LOAG_03071 [Loa loa]